MTDRTGQAETSARNQPLLTKSLGWLSIVGFGLGIWLWDVGLERRPAEVNAEGWRLLAIFLPLILALMLRPIPGGAAVLIALLVTILTGTLTVEQALGGYISPTVWLVLAAYFISRAIIKAGLARRIALLFVRLMGRNSLGLSYALMFSDTVLASMIPSNSARVGGVMLPITRSLAEIYKSFPGKTAGLLGGFLMLTLYQGDVINCSLFLTGQASNPLAAKQAGELANVTIGYGSWFIGALGPALVSLMIVPWLIYRWEKPEITRTPAAAEFARDELKKMGRPQFAERVVIAVFIGVCSLWVLSDYVPFIRDFFDSLDAGKSATIAIIALTGVAALLLSGVLTWDDVVTEKGAWDVYIWYGGLVQLGKMLNETGILKLFAESIAAAFGGWTLIPLFVAMLLIYFYAHYGFASITVHVVAMYPAFVPVLIAAGVPPALTAYAFAYFANFAAGLTHYGTTPAPIVFSAGYVPQGTWWRVGFLLSVIHAVIWLTVGMMWWKLIGLW